MGWIRWMAAVWAGLCGVVEGMHFLFPFISCKQSAPWPKNYKLQRNTTLAPGLLVACLGPLKNPSKVCACIFTLQKELALGLHLACLEPLELATRRIKGAFLYAFQLERELWAQLLHSNESRSEVTTTMHTLKRTISHSRRLWKSKDLSRQTMAPAWTRGGDSSTTGHWGEQ